MYPFEVHGMYQLLYCYNNDQPKRSSHSFYYSNWVQVVTAIFYFVRLRKYLHELKAIMNWINNDSLCDIQCVGTESIILSNIF